MSDHQAQGLSFSDTLSGAPCVTTVEIFLFVSSQSLVFLPFCTWLQSIGNLFLHECSQSVTNV